MDKHKRYLHKMLSSALIQIREDAHANKNKKIYWISHLLHNLPSDLLKKDADYESLFYQIKEDAKISKMQDWFDKEITQINS